MSLDLNFSPRGWFFADLVKELVDVTEEGFLEVCPDPFLLQFPFTRRPIPETSSKASTRPATRPSTEPPPDELDGTLKMSLESVLNASKGRKEAEGARIYRITFTEEPLVVGRSSKANLILPEGTVSNRHAELQRSGGRFTVKDLGSGNGTYIDGRRIPADRFLEFRANQSLWFGSYRTIFITAEKAYEMVAKYGQVAGA